MDLIDKYINEDRLNEEEGVLIEDIEASIDKFLDKIFQKKSIPANKKKKISGKLKSKFKDWWSEMAGDYHDDF